MTEPVGPVETNRLPTLTALRWYAALLVFLYHFLSFSHLSVLRPLGSGYSGVTFFFVLSGFVLTWGTRRGTSARRFWWNRFARIYPSHLVMFVVAAGVFSLLPRIAEPTGPARAAAATFLVSAWGPRGSLVGYNGVSWSLSVEAFFYLCFPLIVVFLGRRRRAGSLVLVGALVLGLAFALWRSRSGLAEANTAYFNPLARLPEFLLGVWMALAVRAGRLPRMPVWPAVGLCVALVALAWRFALDWYPAVDYLLLPGYAALILAGAQADVAGRQGVLFRVLRHPVSIFLGEASFAFYLVHRIVTQALGLGFASQGTGQKVLWLVLSFVASVAAAAALHLFVEKPARRALMRVPRAVRGAAARAGVTAASPSRSAVGD